MPPGPITAQDLDQWAATYPAKSEFPRLVSRLIWASCDEIEILDMPGGKEVYLPGFDGIVQCGRGDDMVPTGLSVWEVSTEDRIRTKAEEDYGKRTNKPIRFDRKDVTFVFATPRQWPNSRNWVDNKKKLNMWKDVRVLCSRHLETWLDRVPWIAADFGLELFGRACTGIRSIEMVWDDYLSVPFFRNKNLESGFVLAGRNTERDALGRWLTSTPRNDDAWCLRISGPTRKEILHFLAACVHSLPISERQYLGSRIYAVSTDDAAVRLRGINSSHVLIAEAPEVGEQIIRQAKRCNCRVIQISPHDGGDSVDPPPFIQQIKLSPIDHNLLLERVIGFGYSQEKAIHICKTCEFDYERVRRAVFNC
jgi:hypothetical protein